MFEEGMTGEATKLFRRKNDFRIDSQQIMDEFANNPAMEFGAVNITGFRLVPNNSKAYEEVFTERSRQNWPDPKSKKITVSRFPNNLV